MIGPILLLVVLESTAYVWEQRQAEGQFAWELVASRRIDYASFEEGGIGYTLMRPNSHYEYQGIPVDINESGLRGPDQDMAKPEDTFRILSLGDSVTMGWGVHEEETYSRLLEGMLNDSAVGDMRFEIINAGVPAWNPANALSFLRAEGMEYAPDLILYDLTIANDINGKSALEANQRPAPIEWMRANTYFWPFITIQMRTLAARVGGQERMGMINPPTNAARYFPLDPEAERWSLIWNTILEMNALAAAQDVPLVVLLFPVELQVVDDSFPLLPQEVMSSRALEAGIPLLDLHPNFQQACQDKPPNGCELEDRYLFADVWMHPSAYGHQLTADAIYNYLRSEDFGGLTNGLFLD